jgi:hypothetical protein
MANVVTATDWLEHKARRNYIDYTSSGTKDRKAEVFKKNMPNNYINSTNKRDQTVKTTSGDKHYGGVKKAKYPSAFKQPFLYDTLIAMAIRNSQLQALNVAQIHAYIAEMYPYFKACPGSLKANIMRTLSSSTCFKKLGEPCEQYWTLTSKTDTCITEEPRRLAKTTEGGLKTIESLPTASNKNYTPYLQPTPVSSITVSKTRAKFTHRNHFNHGISRNADNGLKRTGSLSEKSYSQATVSTTNYTPYSQYIAMHPPSTAHSQATVSRTPFSQPTSVGPSTAHSQATVSARVSTTPNSQPDIPYTVHWPANYRQTGLTHDDKLRHYIHNSPLYPRVPVITPTTGQRQLDESGIKIGHVFSLSPQTSTVLSAQERLRTKVIPYHPCTFWSYGTHNSPALSSFVSEDKERYEDA